MSKGLKGILGIVAAIAIPFAAPFIAGALGLSGLIGGFLGSTALGSTLGGALVGAGLGAGTAAATGQSIGKGALFGGLGGGIGGFTQAGGLSSLFGGSSSAGAGAGAAGAAAPIVPTGGEGLVGGATAGAAVPAGAGAPLQLASAAPAAGLGAATGGVGGAVSSIGSSIARFGVNPSSLASLAMTMFNKPPEGLTAAEQAAVRETASLAATDRGLFNQRVEQARAMINAGTPNSEQAFANVAMQVERQAREATRGGTEYDERRAALDRQRLGAGAVAQEAARANQSRVAGLQVLPGQAPLGEASRTLPVYAAAQRREDEYERDLARAIGGGGMFGARGLFS